MLTPGLLHTYPPLPPRHLRQERGVARNQFIHGQITLILSVFEGRLESETLFSLCWWVCKVELDQKIVKFERQIPKEYYL